MSDWPQSANYQGLATNTTPFTIPSGVNFYLDASATSGADQTVNLPTAIGSFYTIVVAKADSNAYNIVITPNGTDTIDGNATYTLTTEYQTVTLLDVGSGLWRLVGVKAV